MSKRFATWLGALAVLVAAPLAAQTSPTPENTVITNNVQVTYTDANGNTYSPATASVSVTVGFKGSIDVQSAATASPSSPSTGNQLNFTIYNLGNGTDSVSVTTSAAAGTTITGYKIGATTYADLTALNAALAANAITGITGSVVVTVVYNVASAMGGQTLPISLTATSRRDGTKTDASTTNVVPPVFGGVTTTADVASIQRLPGPTSPATYSTTFTVSNGANSSRTFNLTGNASNSNVVVASVNGGTATVTIAANSTASVTVTYTVADVAAGSTGNVTLTATAADDAGVTSTGTHTVTVVKPALTLVKEAFRQNQTTIIGASDRVLPAETIYYKLTITNTGTADAYSLALTDQLPTQVTYVSNSAPGSWTVTYNSGTTTVSASLTGQLAAGASNVIWIAVTVK